MPYIAPSKPTTLKKNESYQNLKNNLSVITSSTNTPPKIPFSQPTAYSSYSNTFSTQFLSKSPRGYPIKFSSRPTSPTESLASSSYDSSSASSSTSSLDDEFQNSFKDLQHAVSQIVPRFINTKLSPELPISLSSTATTSASSTTTISTSSSMSTLMPPSPIASPIETSPIVRKKSGERVKSSLKLPALIRHQSMPVQSKIVHFDVNLEQVRHFLHSEKPAAVSSPVNDYTTRPQFHWGSTDSESESDSDEEEDPRVGYQRYLDRTEWHISLPNFTAPDGTNESRPVYVENLFLTTDKSKLIGHVAVKNIAFEKHVSIKYTLDNWKTITELVAEYNDDVRRKHRPAGYDRFSFAITMADLPQQATTGTKSLFFCVRYSCNNTEYWDNKDTANYQIDFLRVPKHKAQSTGDRLPTRQRRSNSVDNPMRVYDDVLESTKKNEFNSRYDFNDSVLKKIQSHPKSAENKFALNAKTYQELIDSYCFFQGPKGSPVVAATTPRSMTPEHMYDQPQWNSRVSV